MTDKMKNSNGFTLVELIVILVILAILAAIMTPALLGYIDSSKEKECGVNRKAFLMHWSTEKVADPERLLETVIDEWRDRIACPSGGIYSAVLDGDGDWGVRCSIHGDSFQGTEQVVSGESQVSKPVLPSVPETEPPIIPDTEENPPESETEEEGPKHEVEAVAGSWEELVRYLTEAAWSKTIQRGDMYIDRNNSLIIAVTTAEITREYVKNPENCTIIQSNVPPANFLKIHDFNAVTVFTAATLEPGKNNKGDFYYDEAAGKAYVASRNNIGEKPGASWDWVEVKTPAG